MCTSHCAQHSCRLSLACAGDLTLAPSAGAANVTYFIQAEHILHDFAPGGLVDVCTGLPLEGETSVRALSSALPQTLLKTCDQHKRNTSHACAHKWVLLLDL